MVPHLMSLLRVKGYGITFFTLLLVLSQSAILRTFSCGTSTARLV